MKRITGIALICILMGTWSTAALAQDFLVGGLELEASTAQPSPGETNPADTPPPASQAPKTGADADYREALEMMEEGDLIAALNAFAKIGQYEDAVRYAAYLEAKLSFLRNTPDEAAEGFDALGDFLDSASLAAQARALSCHRFQQGGLFGFVDGSGQAVAQPGFDWAERSFRKESIGLGDPGREPLPVAAVFLGSTYCDGEDLLPRQGRYGLLRRDGELIVPIAYDEILWAVEGLGALRSGGAFTLVDLGTGQILGEGYEGVGEFGEGLIPVKSLGKWGYLKRNGEMLPGGFAWDSALPFREGLAGVSQEGRAGFIDAGGQVVIPLVYDEAASFGEGLAGVRQGKKWGFVNPQGEMVVKPAFWEVGIFSQGRCRARRNSKWGVIDTEGKWVIPYKYDEITDFDPIYRRAWMRNNKLWGLLSLEGVVLKPTWATFTPFAADGMSAVSYKGSYGYIDIRGVNRIPNGFEKAAAFSAGMGGVRSGAGTVEYLNKLGRGFSVVSGVPTQPLNGFIEGRLVTGTPVVRVNPATGKRVQAFHYAISFLLYDLEGNPVDVR
ncbi:MAG: WG repeat-containing protein [Candidatus Limiplasma sp.]|nr:WG repeat-containing protein [Candidatus Limiplasma sp.]